MGSASPQGSISQGPSALALERVERNIASEIHTANMGFVTDKVLSVYRASLQAKSWQFSSLLDYIQVHVVVKELHRKM